MKSKNKSRLRVVYFVTVVSFVIASCTYDERNENINPCSIPATVSFQMHIKPILDANCVACHSTADAAASLNYETYSGVQAPAVDGRLVGSIKHLSGFVPMPEFAPKLSDCDIMKIESWVKQGALNN